MPTIFSRSIKTSRKGTAGEKGTGFGMPLAETFMKQLNGDIFISSKVKPNEASNDNETIVGLHFKEAL